MKRISKAPEVEARLHRSLMNQVRVPRLDRRFDAGVWARIEAQEHAQALASQPVSRRSGVEKWLMTSNVVGIAVAAVLVLFFGLRMFSGVEVEVSLPDLSVVQSHQVAVITAYAVTSAALIVAAMFTPLGRWLRAEFT
jgi:negative regulator of sigma E activity